MFLWGLKIHRPVKNFFGLQDSFAAKQTLRAQSIFFSEIKILVPVGQYAKIAIVYYITHSSRQGGRRCE